MRCAMVLTSFLTVLLLGSAARAAPPPAANVPLTRKAVDEKMAALVAALWKAQNAEGHWDDITKPHPIPKDKTDIKELNNNRGGQTALVLLALKAAGEKEDDERFQKALKWLAEQPWHGTYFRGLRASLYGQLVEATYHGLLRDDGKFLLDALYGGDGMYSYYPPPPGTDQAKARGGDYSNTQYGILGIWAAAEHGGEIPAKFWEIVGKGYLESQKHDGSWGYGYGREGEGYGSMTVAGLATCYVIWDKYFVANDADCRGKVDKELVAAIGRGLDWMGKNFSAVKNPGRDSGYLFYYYYGIERVGVASGLKYFGTTQDTRHDWFREITSNYLNKKVAPNGLLEQSWLLLFLSYGRAPVAFNKLDWGGDWNLHPRDMAGLCKYLGRRYEHHHNWQIMPLGAAQDEFQDAPVLAVSGATGLQLKPDDVLKIKTYLQRGGTLFAEALGGGATFSTSVKKFCQQMFPSLEMVRIPVNHPIYTCHSKLTNGQPQLLGLSDGVRLLVILSQRDISCNWQRSNFVSGRTSFEFGDNLIDYTSDRGQLWSKEESYWPTDQHRTPDAKVTIGRVVHGPVRAEHIWNPTGGAGWQRLDILSRNAGGPAIATTQCDLAVLPDVKLIPILHLTGTDVLNLADEAKKNLKAYASAGGLVLVDAAGGRQQFVDSFTKQAEDIFGSKLAPVPPADLPFLGQIGEDGKIWYRHRNGLPRSLRALEVLGITPGPAGQAGAAGPAAAAGAAAAAAEPRPWNVLFLPYDLTYALNGAPASEPVGLETKSAEQLAAALITWRTNVKVPVGPPPVVAEAQAKN